MVKVCEDFLWYRKDGKTIPVKDESEVPKGRELHRGFWMDGKLKEILDSMAFNVQDDMDFVITITGGGGVRVGKSLLAIQIAYYLSKKMGVDFNMDHIVFTAEKLMTIANEAKKPKNSVFIYDEAREAMNSKMALANIQKKLQQFFAECGQLNDIFILCLPDFFELNKQIAINRCEILIDCFFQKSKTKDKDGCPVVKMERGHYRIFKRINKRILYIKGKEMMNYTAWKPNITNCRWNNIYPIDEDIYRGKKLDALKETGNTQNKRQALTKESLLKPTAENIIKLNPKMTMAKLADMIGTHPNTLRNWGFHTIKGQLKRTTHLPEIKKDLETPK